MSGGHREPRMTEARSSRKSRVLFEAPSLGDEMTPHAETLEKSSVSVIFMPKSMFTAFDTSFRTCWTRTY